MNVLSLFDGISCAKVALERASIEVKSYKACEIDPYAIAVSKHNHPSILHLGDVKNYTSDEPVDLLIGGSPCIDLSIAKQNRKGLAGDYSSLFWEFVRIKNLCKPKWFVLENVASMRDSDKKTISDALGVQPILIDASLVSAQRRKRLFWTNIPVQQPADRGITLSTILLEKGWSIGRMVGRRLKDGKRDDYNTEIERKQVIELSKNQSKSGTLTKIGKDTLLVKGDEIRRLHPIECERLQSLPDDYTAVISNTRRYIALGNAFNVEVIAHILKGI